MNESEGEIEYLDEDEEIVQQCVQPSNTSIGPVKRVYPTAAFITRDSNRSLLVERDLERRRKRKKDEEDSDYDPKEDLQAIEAAKKNKKKPILPIRKVIRPSYPVNTTFITSTGKKAIAIDDIRARKRLDIRIPDYDDPLCLPVRAIINTNSDLQRVRNWNNMCLEHFKNYNEVQPEKAPTKSSARTIVLRNVVHKETGKQETAVWSKISIEDKEGVKKSEIFQSILPKYREKRVLKSFRVSKLATKFRHVNETILTKEDHKDGNVLVVYKPREKTSAVYKFVQDPNRSISDDDEPKKSLKEVVVCKVCAPCYQTSWRGTKKTGDTPIKCPVCGRSSVSVYNLLTHLRTHPAASVRAKGKQVAATLAKVVEYHYRCRVCQQRYHSIKDLRRHVLTHQGVESFRCDVGNHITK